MLVGFGDGYNGMCFACNGIAQVAAVDFAEIHIVLLESLTQEAVQ